MNELVEVAVENCLRIAGFVPGAVILDELVGLEDVAADLAAEVGLLGSAALAGQLLLAFFLLELGQAGLEDPQRRLLIGGLGALVLALDDDPGRDVGDSHGGVRLVAV